MFDKETFLGTMENEIFIAQDESMASAGKMDEFWDGYIKGLSMAVQRFNEQETQ